MQEMQSTSIGSGKYRKIRDLTDIVIEQQKKDYDFPMLISGGERSGKSELGIMLQKIVAKKNGLKFDVEGNVAYDNSEIEHKIRSLTMRSGIQADELIRGLYKMDFARTETKELVKLFAQIGVKLMFFTMCIPRMVDVVEYLRNHRIKLWIHIVTRGHGVIFQPNRNVFIGDSWHVKDNIKKMGRKAFMGMSLDPDAQIRIYEKTNIFVDSFKFPQLDATTREKYQAYSLKKKMEVDQMPDKDTKFRIATTMLSKHLMKDLGYTQAKVQKVLTPEGTDSSIVPRTSMNFLLKGQLSTNDKQVYNNKTFTGVKHQEVKNDV